MEVYLVRHTMPAIDTNICYGQSDLDLRIPYMPDFNRIINQVNLRQPVIYSSPLARCSLLAKYIQLHYNIIDPVVYDARLKELDFGHWELKKWDDLEPGPLNEWMNDFVNYPVPGGESFIQLNHRVNDFIDTQMLKIQNNKPAIIITHGGVIRCFLCRIRNIPLKNAFELQIGYGSVTAVTIRKKL